MKKNPTAIKDTVVIAIVAGCVFVIAGIFDVFEAFVEWAPQYEEWSIDELVVVAVYLAVAFGIFSRRRAKELRYEVTERKEAEERLQASEAELRALFAAMNDVIVVLDSEGRYLKIAPTNPSLLYKPPEDLVGKTLQEVMPAERAGVFQSHIRRALETQQPVNTEYTLPIGDEEVWFAGTVSPMTEDSVLYIARDITERKRAEEELREAEQRFRSAFDYTPVGMALAALDGHYRQVNHSLREILGYSEEELLATTFRDITYPDDLGVSMEYEQRLRKGEVDSYQL